MKTNLLALAFSLVSMVVTAQSTFEKKYPYYEKAFADVVFTQDDGFVMAFISEKDKLYFSLLKTNLQGDTVWTRDYDFNITSRGNTVGTQDSEGNMYVSFWGGSQNLAKLNSAGDILWSGFLDNYTYEMQLTGNTLWIATHGCYLYRMDALTGDSLWRSAQFAHDNGMESSVTSMAVTESGEAVVTASYISGYTGLPFENDFYHLAVNSDTLVVFELQTNIPLMMNDSKIEGNSVLSVGTYHDENDPPTTSYIVRYLPDGTVLSITGQSFGNYCVFYDYVINLDNEMVILGVSFGGDTAHILLHSCTLEGDSLWTRMIGNDSVLAWDLKLSADGGYVACGGWDQTYSIVQPYMFKTDPEGIILGAESKVPTPLVTVYPNPADDEVFFTNNGLQSGTIVISNLLGKIVAELPIAGTRIVWQTGDEHGLFLYSIINSSRAQNGKILVK